MAEEGNCPWCNYSAPPDRLRTERKHFTAHSLRCSRCKWQTETKPSWPAAEAAWRKEIANG